ncbi:hypothetical protein [Ilumatobacter nonamiensis]|uniref:hypothetical protein n=1 Tax=Ilumatobacter nonamiensis TaxID=467093 RepID=UPI000347CA87|nr:hypothetical protein [Ilumatobacter nonamiensis]
MADRLDRDDVSRILARAQDIETHAGATDAGSGIEPEALIEAATEVGIDPNAVRDSLAIERLSVEAGEARRLDRLAGSASVLVEREVPLRVGDALDGIEAWLTSVHWLVCDRRSESSLHARRRTDASAKAGRTVSGVRGYHNVGRVAALQAEAVPQVVGSTPHRPRTIVRIRADRGEARTLRLAGGGAVGVAGAGAGTLAVTSGFAVLAPVIALPLLVGGYGLARTGRGQADRLELELERLLTHVARGERPEGLVGRAVRRARRSVDPSHR